MAVCRIVWNHDTDQCDVYSPFAAKEVIKALPMRSWDKDRRCWTIPAVFLDELVDALRAAGFTTVTTEKGEQEKQDRRPPPGPGSTTGTWADLLFTELGPDLGDRAFKALIKVVHPDTGGSTVLMQQLNIARDKHLRRAS